MFILNDIEEIYKQTEIPKQRKRIKNLNDIYNDYNIMIINPPYPYLPIELKPLFRESEIAIELIEYLDENQNIIEYCIGKKHVKMFRNNDLYEAIKDWNNYCYSELLKKGYKNLESFLSFIFKIFIISLIICFLLDHIIDAEIIIGVYVIWSHFIIPILKEKSLKNIKKSFNSVIFDYAKKHSSYDILVDMDLSEHSKYLLKEIRHIPESKEIKYNKKINKNLTEILRKMNNISKDIFNNKNPEITFDIMYDIINNLNNNYTKRLQQFENTQLEKDIIHYSNNFIDILNLIDKYDNNSKEANKEISEVLINYYNIFKYFNESLIENDELTYISKLKVFNQDSKLYSDYLNIKS